jgi:hypothetical protein
VGDTAVHGAVASLAHLSAEGPTGSARKPGWRSPPRPRGRQRPGLPRSSDGSAVVFNTPAEFSAMLPGELQKYQGLMRQLGIKLE